MADTSKTGRTQEKVEEGVTGAVSTLKQKAGEAAAAAGEMGGQAKGKAQEWASTAAHKAEDARRAVGEGLEALGGKIRANAPESGMLGTTAARVAENIESAGSYLQSHDFGAMGKEVTNLVRRYPIQALLVGLGVGFLLARATRS
jgi:hypothetical protein